jgi:hypothetical protein
MRIVIIENHARDLCDVRLELALLYRLYGLGLGLGLGAALQAAPPPSRRHSE